MKEVAWILKWALPNLSKQELRELVRQAQAGRASVPGLGSSASARKAQTKLVRHMIRLVASVAQRYPESVREDMMQEGITGVLRAAAVFDLGQPTSFLTIAQPWILQTMVRATERERGLKTAVEKSLWRSLRGLAAKFLAHGETVVEAEAAQAYTQKHLKAPTPGAIKLKRVQAALDKIRSRPVMLDSQSDVSHAPSPEAEAIKQDQTNALDTAICKLPVQLQLVMRAKLADLSPADLATPMGVTRQRVQQMEKLALAKLRKYLKRKDFDLE